MAYGYADILDDGRKVVARYSVPIIDFGTTSQPMPEWLMYTRATLHKGHAYAVGQGNGTGTAWLVDDTGRRLGIGLTAGVSPVAIVSSPDGILRVTAQRSATVVHICTIDTVAWNWSTERQVAIQQTSQGLLDAAPDGSPILCDPIDRTIEGHHVRWPSTRGLVTVAQGVEAGAYGCVMIKDNVLGQLSKEDCFEPHQSPNGEWWICRGARTVISGAVPQVPPAIVPDPIIQPTFGPFAHPILIAPFKDPTGALGHTPIEALGVYTENPALTAQHTNQRMIYGYDGETFIAPQGAKPSTWILIECYRDKRETLDQSLTRWLTLIHDALAQTPNDIGLIPMWYAQGGAPPDELWAVQEVLDALAPLTGLINIDPRIKIIAPFAYDRANGIIAHPELRVAFDNLVSAAGNATPTFVPLETPPVIIPPVVIPPVIIPPPTPPFQGALLMADMKQIHYYGTVPSAAPGKVRLGLMPDLGIIASAPDDPNAELNHFGWDHDTPHEQFLLNGSAATCLINGVFRTYLAIPVKGF